MKMVEAASLSRLTRLLKEEGTQRPRVGMTVMSKCVIEDVSSQAQGAVRLPQGCLDSISTLTYILITCSS